MPPVENTFPVALLILLGVASSYQDIRQKRVGNILLLSAVAAYIILYAAGLADPTPWKITDILANAGFAVVASFIMWYAKVWPAGDAKLFMVFALIVPFRSYGRYFFPLFPSFAILINTFVIAVSALLASVLKDAVLYVVKQSGPAGPAGQRAGSLARTLKKASAGLPSFLKSVLLISVIFFTARMIADYALGIESKFFTGVVTLQFVIMFIMYRQIFQFLRTRVSISACLALLAACVAVKFFLLRMDAARLAIYLLGILKMAVLFMGSIQVIMAFFDYYIKTTQTVPLPLSELKKGMVLEKEFGEIVSEQCRARCDMKLRPDGLDATQVKTIHETFPPDFTAKITRTYPFAPIIFSGVILTMLLRQSVLHMLLAAIKKH